MLSKLILIICLTIKLVSSKSFTLVVDTTNSMQDEVSVIKRNIEPLIRSIRSSSNLQNYIIVPFNDPDVGPPVISDSPDRFIDTIYTLTTNGGTDCPENSLAGIQKALEVSNDNSDIFVYTDAYAKDYEKVDAIKRLCVFKKSKVVIFLSGFCPADVASLKTYNSIAEYCSGAILQLTPSTMRGSFKYINEMVRTEWTDVSTLNTINNADHTTFSVEAYTTELMIVITGTYPSILLKKISTEESIEYESIVRSENYMVIRIKPEAGTYDAIIRGDACVARLYKRNKLPFQYGFSTMLARSMKETTLRPIPDRTNYICILIPDNINYRLTKIELKFSDGTDSKSLTPEQIPNNPGMYFTKTFLGSRKGLSILIHLTSVLDNNFITGSTDIIQPQIFATGTTWIKPVIDIIELNNNLLDSGANLTIASRITAYPKPEIWWEDDMGGILQSENVLLEIPSVYISYVNVNNVMANTTIYCKSKNYKGEESQSIELFVNRTATLEVIQTPKDETFEYGSEGRLYCEIKAYPESNTIWYHNDTTIDFKNNDMNIVSEENGILIKNMSFDNIGKYKCEVTNTVETESFSATVEISGVESPEVEIEKSEINLKPGDNVEVECKIIKGKPVPIISWTYKSDDSYEFNTTPVGVFNDEGKLKFSSVSKENKGTYKCMANNALGEDSKELTVKLQYSPIIKNSEEETLIVREGKSVQLECDVDAIPKANIRWEMSNYNDVVPFDEGHNTDNHNTHSFIAFSRDSGSYHCIAENEFGRAEKTVFVDVKVPPYIQPPESTTVNLITGDSVTLLCNVLYGNPAPVTRWEFIAPGSKSIVILRGSTTNKLVLRNVNKINEGYYVCIADNDVDSDRIKIYVKVI
ncbi:hemicentin-1-like [Aphomia sociella]